MLEYINIKVDRISTPKYIWIKSQLFIHSTKRENIIQATFLLAFPPGFRYDYPLIQKAYKTRQTENINK